MFCTLIKALECFLGLKRNVPPTPKAYSFLDEEWDAPFPEESTIEETPVEVLATNILINTSQFAKALKGLKPAIPSKPTHFVLAYYYLEVSNDRLIIRASDLTNTVETSIPITRELGDYSSCSVCIPARHHRWFHEFIEKIDSPSISLHFAPESLEIKFGFSSYKFNGVKGNEFVAMPELSIPIATVQTDRIGFIQKFKQVEACVSGDICKQSLTGVHLLQQGTDLRFEATDGHRLAIDWLPSEITGNADLNAIVQTSFIDILAKFEGSQNLVIEFFHDLCQIRMDEVTIYSRLIDATYPPVERLVVNPKNWVKFNPKQLTKQVKVAQSVETKTFARGRAIPVVSLIVGKNELLVKGCSDTGEIVGRVSAIASPQLEGMEVNFNSKYLLSLLEKMGKEGEIGLFTSTQPVVMKPESGAYFLLMPTQDRS